MAFFSHKQAVFLHLLPINPREEQLKRSFSLLKASLPIVLKRFIESASMSCRKEICLGNIYVQYRSCSAL
jgi:hypothetical protein